MLAFPIGVLPLLVLAVVVVIMLRLRGRGGDAALAEAGDMRVPLRASFGSTRGWGPFASTHNSLNPLLILHGDSIEYRVVKRRTAAYADIGRVDASTGTFRSRLVLEFAGSNFTFTGNLRSGAALAEALRYLEAKGLPLSHRARAIASGAEQP